MATTEWQSITIGQNKKIQEVVSAAAKASDLLNTNVALAKGGLQAAQVFIQGILNPKILLLTAIADEIDKFVEDLKGTGFYILECSNPQDYVLPKDADGNLLELVLSPIAITSRMAIASTSGIGMCVDASGKEIKYSTSPTGKEYRDDTDGDLVVSSAMCERLGGKWDMSKGGHGIGGEFYGWAKEFLFEPDIFNTGPTKSEYKVKQGKSRPKAKRTSNANDDIMAEKDEITGLYKMTPSQMITTMMAAMDDKKDRRRPQFSSSAEAGAIVFIIGVSDMTKNLPDLYDIVLAFLKFFGGENGLLTQGAQNLGDLLGAVVGGTGWVNNLDETEVKLTVKNVCGVRGTDEDAKKCAQAGIPYNFGSGGKTASQFEVNDYVVGPYLKFGRRCKGYVTEVRSTTEDPDDSTYVTQELTIQGVTDSDAICFRALGSGAKLQKVAYKQSTTTFIDQNSGEKRTDGPNNDYYHMGELYPGRFEVQAAGTSFETSDYETDNEWHQPTKAGTKVERKKGEILLTLLDTEDVVEEHTYRNDVNYGRSRARFIQTPSSASSFEAGRFETYNTVQGDIFVAVDNTVGPPPNFKAAKLEDLIGEFTTFFSAIKMLTNTLRDIAKGSADAVEKMVKFLDSKIKELEEINTALQKILALFTTGLPDAGVYTLVIPVGAGGNDYIKQELQRAENRPPDSLDFTFGFMMVGGGPATKTLQSLLTSG